MRDVAANGSLAQPLQLINLFHLILFYQFPFLSENTANTETAMLSTRAEQERSKSRARTEEEQTKNRARTEQLAHAPHLHLQSSCFSLCWYFFLSFSSFWFCLFCCVGA